MDLKLDGSFIPKRVFSFCLKGNRLIVHRRHDRNMYFKSFLTLTLFKLMLMSGVWKKIFFITD